MEDAADGGFPPDRLITFTCPHRANPQTACRFRAPRAPRQRARQRASTATRPRRTGARLPDAPCREAGWAHEHAQHGIPLAQRRGITGRTGVVGPTRRLGSRGFRAWLSSPDDDRLQPCGCEWAPELGPHFTTRLAGGDLTRRLRRSLQRASGNVVWMQSRWGFEPVRRPVVLHEGSGVVVPCWTVALADPAASRASATGSRRLGEFPARRPSGPHVGRATFPKVF
jgi:hypothetical protein